MILDPGVSPEGCEIEDSTCEHVRSDDDEDEED
jgi:hypothetical protein